ncbi:MAG: pyridoxine 5'-phosphate synthase [Deltaproteobacteria bacterium]|nr:pyridoxine 5'-phosphate synthase [Deltaproteobacteria bacterium]MBW2047899.1 pyridoxine 5'-phosphate synthase [Deltaproteobacteria bacterium]MBW2110281.1 pyridoxine 5'-phosphate synthase [Deltaproteobacteria bacterium]MBW2352058.1 pyridoxine 5'-phosphate synthase [Deltaproteobacteria bacterium]HDZ91303.1 pyridoxine 5'-phosphate synthase [Deltaproteobacteria bacterium]
MARLAVNVDHVATVREARGINEPDPVFAAGLAELAGAEGIICHLREDRRHINDRDLRLLRETVKTRLNMEMAAVDEMVEIAIATRPDMVTLVPEKREELTTEGGLDVRARPGHYTRATEGLKGTGIEVSFFVDPDPEQVRAARDCGADIVEIHTGHYAEARSEEEAARLFGRIVMAVESAAGLDLGISAGHGLNYLNVKRFKDLPQVREYSIGHSIVAMAVYIGFERAVSRMVDLVKGF